jgi:spore germination cell wall hydrolase CwlJ-like protein
MVASRTRPKGVRYYGPFGLSVLAMGLMPRPIGYQDTVALMARQPEVSQRARAHMLASPFGTIHAATFSFPRPVGTLIPEPPLVRLASIAARDAGVTGAIARDFSDGVLLPHRPRFNFPIVNRRLKGDLLVTRPREQPPDGTRDPTPGRIKTVSFPRPADVPRADAMHPDVALGPASPQGAPEPVAAPPAARREPQFVAAPGRSEADVVTAAVTPATTPATMAAERETEGEALVVTAAPTPKSATAGAAAAAKAETGSAPYKLAALSPSDAAPADFAPPLFDPIDDSNPAVRLGRLYFGNIPVGEAVGPIQPWPTDAELLIETPPANDPDIKLSALAAPIGDINLAAPEPLLPQKGDAMAPAAPGQSVAPKGEVTGPGKRPKTPAERLALDLKQRAKAEKCLAEAVYFESRGETKRGQIAVAQVVMNRVFSGFYPTNVCGVVYQNAHRKFACQFTFACDNVPDVVEEPDMWAQAKEIARDMLDGKLWLPEIGYSTHYHAYWVHPSWVNEMRRMHKIGVHSFYRPRAWGDGSDAPPLNQSQVQAGDAAKAKL